MSSQGWLYFWESFAAVGTITVIIGLFVEYGFSAFSFLKFWGAREIPESHIKVETPREHKGSALVVIGITVELISAFGVLIQSYRVDIQHRIELAQLGEDTAHANERAANAEHQTAEIRLRQSKVERLLSGQLELDADSSLFQLNKFAGTPYFVKTMPTKIAFMRFRQPDDSEKWFASLQFAASFRRLDMYAGWKFNSVPDEPTGMPVMDGVELLTWRARDRESPEYRAFQAAEALRCVLIGQLGIEPFHHEVTVLPEYPSLPKDGILIEVGSLRADKELSIRRLEGEDSGCENQTGAAP